MRRVIVIVVIFLGGSCKSGIENGSQHFAEQHTMQAYAQVLSLQLLGEQRGAPRPPATKKILADMRAEFISACVMRLADWQCEDRAREIEAHAEDAQHWTVR